jgi:hypothetical protein
VKVGEAWTENPTQLLLLGIYHFREREDILGERRQQEVAEVVELLGAFRPTTVALERHPGLQEQTERDYRAYVAGTYALRQDEIDQFGFRLAQRTGAKLRCVNAWDRYFDPPVDIEALPQRTLLFWEIEHYLVNQTGFNPWRGLEDYARAHGLEHLLTEWAPRVSAYYQERTAYLQSHTLREHLLRINDEDEIWKSHADVLVGRFKVGEGNEFPGPDLVAAWYVRNLRIFANLQRISAPGERILLIVGYSHLPILRHCALASPEHELVEVASYLAKSDETA